MSEQTINVDGNDYAVADLSEAALAYANSALMSDKRMGVAKADFEIAQAAREYYTLLLKEAIKDVEPMEKTDVTDGSEE